MIDYLKKHEKIPIAQLMWKGNKVYLINKYTSIKHQFLNGETEVKIPAKQAQIIKERYERLQ